jgi:hypothetical protein
LSRVLAKRGLVLHPDSPKPPLQAIGSKVTRVGSDVLKIEYVAIGEIGALRIPTPAVPERADALWRHTCFEAFVGLGDGKSYVEFNFSLSRRWAIYRFEDYRAGMCEPIDLAGPDVFVEIEGPRLALTAWLDLSPLAGARPVSLGLAAVIESQAGALSYWALAHPPGAPDFHHADCFALELPAAEAP